MAVVVDQVESIVPLPKHESPNRDFPSPRPADLTSNGHLKPTDLANWYFFVGHFRCYWFMDLDLQVDLHVWWLQPWDYDDFAVAVAAGFALFYPFFLFAATLWLRPLLLLLMTAILKSHYIVNQTETKMWGHTTWCQTHFALWFPNKSSHSSAISPLSIHPPELVERLAASGQLLPTSFYKITQLKSKQNVTWFVWVSKISKHES